MTIGCWLARRWLADAVDGRASSALTRHLGDCRSCTAELEGMKRLAASVAESACVPTIDSFAFEEKVLREARARRAEGRKGPIGAPVLLRPVPLGAALSLMVAAVALARFFSGVSPVDIRVGDPQAVASSSAAERDLEDGLEPPREIPFVVREDLVGARRGSIPLTTYVLEPAPDDDAARHEARPVVRASL